jgi:hypothetical protein
MVVEQQQATVHAQVEGINEVRDGEQGDDDWVTDEEEQEQGGANEKEKPADLKKKRTSDGTSGIAV